MDMNKKNIATALMVAVVVGSLLNLVNSYDVFFKKDFSGKNILKIMLTYITPFCVSLYSSLKATAQNKDFESESN
jgi:hypothetical protein